MKDFWASNFGMRNRHIGTIRVVVSFFYFSSLFGEMIQFDDHIFQMGGKKNPPNKKNHKIPTK